MSQLSLVIIDDHTLFRNGLQELLTRRNLVVVGMTGVATEAVELVRNTKPDIVLLDLRMPEVGGLQVLQDIRSEMPDQRVVILTTSVEERDLLEALRLGASGYLLKDMEPDTFAKLLHQAKAGEMVVAAGLAGLLAQAVVAKGKKNMGPGNTYKLTPREMEILYHIAQGESNRDIAKALNIVDGTVKLHVRAVLKKLGVQSRVQAAVLAVSENLCRNRPG